MPQTAPDPFHLQRFVDAQSPIYLQVKAELTAGAKRSHWMWFIFPQIAGLGSSPTAQHFAIRSMDEAAAFLAHSVLGPRLREYQPRPRPFRASRHRYLPLFRRPKVPLLPHAFRRSRSRYPALSSGSPHLLLWPAG